MPPPLAWWATVTGATPTTQYQLRQGRGRLARDPCLARHRGGGRQLVGAGAYQGLARCRAGARRPAQGQRRQRLRRRRAAVGQGHAAAVALFRCRAARRLDRGQGCTGRDAGTGAHRAAIDDQGRALDDAGRARGAQSARPARAAPRGPDRERGHRAAADAVRAHRAGSGPRVRPCAGSLLPERLPPVRARRLWHAVVDERLPGGGVRPCHERSAAGERPRPHRARRLPEAAADLDAESEGVRLRRHLAARRRARARPVPCPLSCAHPAAWPAPHPAPR